MKVAFSIILLHIFIPMEQFGYNW